MEYWEDAMSRAADAEILRGTYDRRMNVYGWKNSEADGWLDEEKVLKYADVPCGIAYRNVGLAEEDEVAAADCEVRIFCDEGYEIVPGDLLEIDVEIASAAGGVRQDFVRTGAARHYGSHQELTAVQRAI